MVRKISILFVGLFLFYCSSILAQENKIMRGFANIDIAKSTEGKSHFAIGTYTNYIAGTLNDNISYLSELAVHFEEGWEPDLERIMIKYEFASPFAIAVGKNHTPLGYWNYTYHHGTVLHTTVDRPLFLTYEDEGGFMPSHATGVFVSGKDISSAKLYYDFSITNGTGSSVVNDNDESKALTLYVRTKAIDGVDFGFFAYRDHISKGAELPKSHESGDTARTAGEPVNQMMGGVSLLVEKGKLEFLSEGILMQNKGKDSNLKKTSLGFYTLLSYGISEKFRPYARFDLLDLKKNDPLFSPNKTQAYTVGIKYDLSYTANIKVQYTHQNMEDEKSQNSFTTQFSIGF